jgi:hypothetical protein
MGSLGSLRVTVLRTHVLSVVLSLRSLRLLHRWVCPKRFPASMMFLSILLDNWPEFIYRGVHSSPVFLGQLVKRLMYLSSIPLQNHSNKVSDVAHQMEIFPKKDLGNCLDMLLTFLLCDLLLQSANIALHTSLPKRNYAQYIRCSFQWWWIWASLSSSNSSEISAIASVINCSLA